MFIPFGQASWVFFIGTLVHKSFYDGQSGGKPYCLMTVRVHKQYRTPGFEPARTIVDIPCRAYGKRGELLRRIGDPGQDIFISGHFMGHDFERFEPNARGGDPLRVVVDMFKLLPSLRRVREQVESEWREVYGDKALGFLDLEEDSEDAS